MLCSYAYTPTPALPTNLVDPILDRHIGLIFQLLEQFIKAHFALERLFVELVLDRDGLQHDDAVGREQPVERRHVLAEVVRAHGLHHLDRDDLVELARVRGREVAVVDVLEGDEVLQAAFDRVWTSDVQINMHMNGDAAVEQALRAIEKAIEKHGMRDHRPVFVHGTYMRPDQIERARTYGAIPSYLMSSIVSGGAGAMFLWGGERGNRVMAANTLESKGMPVTYSHDAPVTPKPWILPLVDAGVNRTTAQGQVIGEKERVSPYVALKAVTAYAAYQIKEEKTKGTLEEGKLADMVILAQNPLKVDPKTIKDIKVLETIKEGATVFTRE